MKTKEEWVAWFQKEGYGPAIHAPGTLGTMIDIVSREVWQSATKAQMDRCAKFLEHIHSEDGCTDAELAPFPGDPP